MEGGSEEGGVKRGAGGDWPGVGGRGGWDGKGEDGKWWWWF